MLQSQYVTGCVEFKNKKHKDNLWKKLRKELGEKVVIWKEENFLFYKYKETV